MNFSKIVFEAKDVKAFQKDLKDLIQSDSKAKQLHQAYKKDDDKMVDLVDYLMSKHGKKLEESMDSNNISYDEAIDFITKV